jgi:catechol 2,3-dioxygenase-like lactoylglutathione lyase family enzyme
MSRAVHHLAIKVADLGRAERFYTHVVGLPVLRRWDDERGRPRSVWLALGEAGTFLALERAELCSPVRVDDAPGLHCLAFGIGVAEREALRERLRLARVIIERESDYTTYARDPDGNLIGWSHYPDNG